VEWHKLNIARRSPPATWLFWRILFSLLFIWSFYQTFMKTTWPAHHGLLLFFGAQEIFNILMIFTCSTFHDNRPGTFFYKERVISYELHCCEHRKTQTFCFRFFMQQWYNNTFKKVLWRCWRLRWKWWNIICQYLYHLPFLEVNLCKLLFESK